MSGGYRRSGFLFDEQVGRVISPPFRNVGCVQFYYYRTVSTRGSFDVLTQVGDDTPSLVWTVETGDAGWRFASIPIKTKSIDPIKVRVQGSCFLFQRKGPAIIKALYIGLMNEWMNGWINGWMDKWMDKWMDEWMNELMNGKYPRVSKIYS